MNKSYFALELVDDFNPCRYPYPHIFLIICWTQKRISGSPTDIHELKNTLDKDKKTQNRTSI